MAKDDTDDKPEPKASESSPEAKADDKPKASASKARKVPKGKIEVRTLPTSKGLPRVMFRGGLRLTGEPRLVDLADLSEGALASIEAERKLEVRKG